MDINDIRELHELYEDYRQSTDEFQATWTEVFSEQLKRPNLYTPSTEKDALPTISDSSAFVSQLADAEQMSQKELFVALENSSLALKAAQDEYLGIEMLLRHMQGSNTDELHNPQRLEQDFDEYDEKKKAMLYGYKYDSKIDKTSLRIQNPFLQGGFVPTETAFNRMKNAAGSDLRNVDGFEPIKKNGKMMVPRLHWKPKQPKPKPAQTPLRQTRKRLAEEIEATDQSRPTSSDSSSKFDFKPEDKRLTRFAGAKVPPTRETSVTPATSPSPKKRRVGDHTIVLKVAYSPSPAPPQSSPTPSRLQTPSRLNTPTPQSTRVAKPKPAGEPPKWTDESLIAAIREDPTFLHPTDPVKREQRRLKLLSAPNPVRSFSMFSKWGDWRSKGEDKRPRKKSPKI